MGIKLLKTNNLTTTGIELTTKQELINKFPANSKYTQPTNFTLPSNRRTNSFTTSILSIDESYLFFPYTPLFTLSNLTNIGLYINTTAADINTDYAYLYIFNAHPITGLPDTQIVNVKITYQNLGFNSATQGFFKNTLNIIDINTINLIGGRKYWFGLFRKGTTSAISYLPTSANQDYIGFLDNGTFGLCYSASTPLNQEIDKMTDLNVNITLINHPIPWIIFQSI